jgi:hypothetical protein
VISPTRPTKIASVEHPPAATSVDDPHCRIVIILVLQANRKQPSQPAACSRRVLRADGGSSIMLAKF